MQGHKFCLGEKKNYIWKEMYGRMVQETSKGNIWKAEGYLEELVAS